MPDQLRYSKVKITLRDCTEDGALLALDEVKRLIEMGYTSGFAENEDGESYSFTCLTSDD
jgi:hypothetical protein